MSYKNETVIAALKAAREQSALSQRALSAKIGVPQSHISKIESGGSDIRLSSLIELARVLGHELMLVPRHLVPAVEGILRSTPLTAAHAGGQYKPLDDALKQIARRRRKSAALAEITQILRELNNFQLSAGELALITHAKDRLATLADENDTAALASIRSTLQTLRNRIAHAMPPPPQPAYGLDEDDDA